MRDGARASAERGALRPDRGRGAAAAGRRGGTAHSAAAARPDGALPDAEARSRYRKPAGMAARRAEPVCVMRRSGAAAEVCSARSMLLLEAENDAINISYSIIHSSHADFNTADVKYSKKCRMRGNSVIY